MGGLHLAVRKAHDGLDIVSDRGRNTYRPVVASIGALLILVVVQLNGEGLVHCSDRATHDDGPARQIGIENREARLAGKRGDRVELVLGGAGHGDERLASWPPRGACALLG